MTHYKPKKLTKQSTVSSGDFFEGITLGVEKGCKNWKKVNDSKIILLRGYAEAVRSR